MDQVISKIPGILPDFTMEILNAHYTKLPFDPENCDYDPYGNKDYYDKVEEPQE